MEILNPYQNIELGSPSCAPAPAATNWLDGGGGWLPPSFPCPRVPTGTGRDWGASALSPAHVLGCLALTEADPQEAGGGLFQRSQLGLLPVGPAGRQAARYGREHGFGAVRAGPALLPPRFGGTRGSRCPARSNRLLCFADLQREFFTISNIHKALQSAKVA